MGERSKHRKRRQNLDSRIRFQRMHQAVDDGFMHAVYNETAHKIRHKKKLRKLNERFHHHHHHHGHHHKSKKNESRQAMPTMNPTVMTEPLKVIDPTNIMEPIKAFAENLTKNPIEFSIRDNRTIILLNATVLPAGGRELIRSRIEGQDHCYNTNEVLEIIAVTCLVNFIFWFVIISCVNYYTKKEKVRYTSWETLESAELPPEYEVRFEDDRSYENLVQSIPSLDILDETIGENYIPEMMNNGYVSACDGRECCPKHCLVDEERLRWALVSGEALTDHLPRLKDWKNSRMSFGASSHSMENLIF